MNRTLLGLAILLVSGALALAWLFSGDDLPHTPAVVAPNSTSPAAGTTHDDGARLLKGDDDRVEATRMTVDASAKSDARAKLLLADATWVDVEVRLPSGTPADEKLELYSVVFAPDRFPDDEALDEGLVLYNELRGEGAFDFGRVVNPADGTRAEELPCESLGANRFRAPFPKGSKKGLLRLASRYAYLAEHSTIELPSPPIRLAPALGAWLTANLRLPGNLPDDIDPAALDPFEIGINGFRMSADGERYGARTVLAQGLEFEFGGLHPGLTYILQGKSPQFTAFKDTQLTPQSGEHVVRQYDLRIGAFIAGRVVDESGAGVAGAKIDVRGKRQRGFFGGASQDRSVSDAEGRFALRAVEPGKTTLTATLDGYVAGTSDELELLDGQRVTLRDIVLRRGQSLAGRVLWPDETPAAGVRVTVVERETKGQRRSRTTGSQLGATTDADGRFTISGMTAESVNVQASLQLEAQGGDKVAGPWTASRDEFPLGSELVLTLQPPQEVRGRVVDDLGAPIAKFTVHQESGGKLRGMVIADKTFETKDGTFTLMLAVGNHKLYADAEDYGASPKHEITLPSALDVLTFALPRAAAISGLVLDPAGSPVAGASIEDDGEGSARWLRSDDEKASKSGADGRFEVKCATPGSVTLVASKIGFAPSEPQTLEVIPGQPITDVVFALRIGGRLEGEIYAASGAPDAGRQIMVGNFLGGGSVSETATSDVAGHFVLDHLAPGKHSVMAIPKADQFAGAEGEEDPSDLMSSMKMTTVDIVDGETTHVVLGAPPRAPVRLSGRVTQAGKPFSAGIVMAIADGKSMLDSMKMGKLDGDGNYAITLDAPGDYTIVVGQRMGDDQSAEFQETIPEVREYKLDFVVPLGGIRGRVTGRDGRPLANVPISLESEGRASLFSMGAGRRIQTNDGGRFELKSLKPGTYTLRAGASSMGFPAEGKLSWGVGVRTGLVVEADRVLDGVELRLEPPGAIAGRVFGPDGKPVAEAAVFVRDAEGRLLNPLSSCTSDGLGKFTFDNAPIGTCTVSARIENLASRESAPLRITEGQTAQVELRLEPGTTLRVTVEDGEGGPVRASLRVVDESGRDFSNMMSDNLFETMFSDGYSSTETRVGPLPNGKYRVTATAPDGTNVTRPVTLTGQEERALKIKLKE